MLRSGAKVSTVLMGVLLVVPLGCNESGADNPATDTTDTAPAGVDSGTTGTVTDSGGPDTQPADTETTDSATGTVDTDTRTADTQTADSATETVDTDTRTADTQTADSATGTVDTDTRPADTQTADSATETVDTDTQPADTQTADSATGTVDTETADTGPAVNCPDPRGLAQCVADMAKQGGGTVVLAAQRYVLTDTVDLKDNVNIVGQGTGATVIAWDDAVKDTIDAPVLWASKLNNVALSDFTIECSIDQDPSSSDLRNDHIGIYMYGGGDPTQGEATDINHISLARIEVYYCSHGIHIKGATDVVAVDLNLHHNGNTEVDFFHNIYWRRVGHLVVKQTTPTSGGYWASPRGHGIRGSHLIDVYFENLSVYDNADHGIHVDNVYNMRLANMDVHDNCANPNGSCNEEKCYQTCDIDWNAPVEENP